DLIKVVRFSRVSQRAGDRVLGAGIGRYGFLVRAHQDRVNVWQFAEGFEKRRKLGGRSVSYSSRYQSVFNCLAWVCAKDLRDEGPGARAWKRILVPVKLAKQMWLEAQESNYLRANRVANRPLAPVVQIHFKFEMRKTTP